MRTKVLPKLPFRRVRFVQHSLKTNQLSRCVGSVPKGRLRIRAVQISGLVDPVALILLDKRVLQPVIAKSGWGEGSGRLRNVLSKCFAIELPIVGRFRFFDGRLGFSCPKES